MKYCVVKNTTTVIDGSDNPREVMLKNALSAGFSESQVEILTESEYLARKAPEPILTPQPTPLEQVQSDIQKIIALSMLRSSLLEDALNDANTKIEALETKGV